MYSINNKPFIRTKNVLEDQKNFKILKLQQNIKKN